MIDLVKRMIAETAQRTARIIRRGIMRTGATSAFVQVAAADGEQFDGVENWQQFGFASRPPAGTEALVLLVDGNPDQAVCTATQSRGDRPAGMAVGDACLFSAVSGSDQAAVKCLATGDVDVYCGTGDHVHIGGPTGAQEMLLGVTVRDNLLTFATACKASADVTLAAAATALEVAINAGWLATKGKVV
jgi:phage gp45-like